jgi:hypothetical protein
MLERAERQAERIRGPDWQEPTLDRWQPHAQSFRATVGRSDPAVVQFLLRGLRASDVVLDVGAGRFSLPLAAAVYKVIAIEPSPAMLADFRGDLERDQVRNVELIQSTWEDAPELHVDAAFAAHVVYHVHAIEAFLRTLHRAAGRWAALVSFAGPPQAHLFPFWERVHGEPRAPGPHLPQLVAVLESLGFRPAVELADVPLWPLGPPERARATLRRRLYVRPDTPADARLLAVMRELLDERDEQLDVRGATTTQIGLVRWATHP